MLTDLPMVLYDQHHGLNDFMGTCGNHGNWMSAFSSTRNLHLGEFVHVNVLIYLKNKLVQARIQDFALGGGVAYDCLRHLIPSAHVQESREVRGYLPPGNFEEIGYLRQHFIRFGHSLLGNKAGKSERH